MRFRDRFSWSLVHYIGTSNTQYRLVSTAREVTSTSGQAYSKCVGANTQGTWEMYRKRPSLIIFSFVKSSNDESGPTLSGSEITKSQAISAAYPLGPFGYLPLSSYVTCHVCINLEHKHGFKHTSDLYLDYLNTMFGRTIRKYQSMFFSEILVTCSKTLSVIFSKTDRFFSSWSEACLVLVRCLYRFSI